MSLALPRWQTWYSSPFQSVFWRHCTLFSIVPLFPLFCRHCRQEPECITQTSKVIFVCVNEFNFFRWHLTAKCLMSLPFYICYLCKYMYDMVRQKRLYLNKLYLNGIKKMTDFFEFQFILSQQRLSLRIILGYRVLGQLFWWLFFIFL